MGWVGTLAVAHRSFIDRDEGARSPGETTFARDVVMSSPPETEPHPTSQPLLPYWDEAASQAYLQKPLPERPLLPLQLFRKRKNLPIRGKSYASLAWWIGTYRL